MKIFKFYILWVLSMWVLPNTLWAQDSKMVSGIVKDQSSGEILIGVKVILRTQVGDKKEEKVTGTDVNGSYKMESFSKEDKLIFKMTGYREVTETIGTRSTIHVNLPIYESSEIVVTSLGQEREQRAVAFSIQSVNAKQIASVPTPSLLSNIDGKVAGIDISGGGAALGSATRIISRGSRSIQGNNQALIVIDGIPVDNYVPYNGNGYNAYGMSTSGGTKLVGAGIIGDDGLSILNLSDIDNVNFIKGATGAALYGGQAANGVIMISTKKGKMKEPQVDISSSTTFLTPSYLPDLQYTYPSVISGGAPNKYSWGTATGGVNLSPNYLNDFYKIGVSTMNGFSVGMGIEKFQFYGSYSNTYSQGTLVNNDGMRHNLNFRTYGKISDNLSMSVKFTFINQNTKGIPTAGFYNNPLSGLYVFPRSLNFNDYKQFQILNTSRNIMSQNWPLNSVETLQQNPYWIQYNNATQSERLRYMVSATGEYKFADFLSFEIRGSMDRTDYSVVKNFYAGTDATISDITSGRYFNQTNSSVFFYGDALLTFKKRFDDFAINAIAGTSISDNSSNGQLLDSYTSGLYIPNYFNISAMKPGSIRSTLTSKKQYQSVFATAQASYKDMLFLEVTGRNDWASTLPLSNNSFFYPSVGLSWVINETFSLPTDISLLKVRGTFSQVGNDIPPFLTNPVSSLDQNGNLALNTTKPFTDLKPEQSTNFEVGFDLDLLQGKIGLNATYYNSLTTNQFFSISAPPSSGYTQYYINAGNIQNQGVEVSLYYEPVNLSKENDGGFKWSGAVNFSKNWNKVLQLSDQITKFTVTDPDVNNYAAYLEVGGSIGDIYGYKMLKDGAGNIVLDATGKPQKDPAGFLKLGNANNQYLLGWKNELSFYGFALNFLIDFRLGGQVISMTQMILDEYGVSKATAIARDNGGVAGNYITASGVKSNNITAANYYGAIASRTGITEMYLYDASVIRLKEVSLRYDVPTVWIKSVTGNIIKAISFSLIGRNLFYFYKPAPFDSQVAGTLSGGLAGLDVFMLPSNLEVGFGIKITL